MADLVVRNVDDEIVEMLNARARARGVSAEVEHRRILEEVLWRPPKRSLVDVLKAIPSVGEDSDFERK